MKGDVIVWKRNDKEIFKHGRTAFYALFILLSFMAICLSWMNKSAAFVMTFIGLLTLAISLITYFLDHYYVLKSNSWIRVFKSMGDTGAVAIVCGTLKLSMGEYSTFMACVFSFFVVILLLITSIKVVNEI